MPRPDQIDLAVYNLAGQRLATVGRGFREAGSHIVQWNGRDDAGKELGSGVYVSRLLAGEQLATRKLLLLR